MAMWFPHWSPSQNAAAALVLAMGLAALSWHLIEKPSLAQKAGLNRVPPKQLKKAAAVAVGCAMVILIGAGLYGLKPAKGPQPVDQPQTIEAFGPKEVVAGKPFNVQQNGLSAMWVQLPYAANAKSSIVFRDHKLETVVSGKLLTASVPNELFAHPGEAEIYVVDESYSPPRRTSTARLTVSK